MSQDRAADPNTTSCMGGSGAVQHRYYTETAANYELMHAGEGDDDPEVMRAVCGLLRMIEPSSLLDVGAGTGRALRYFRDNGPEVRVRGVEPVRALIDQSLERNGIPAGIIVQGAGEALPFDDASFDVVCSFAVLHHVAKPDAVVREMTRVARKAVIVVDSNRFGQGPWPARILKLLLYKTGLWGTVNHIKTRGKGYAITPGDGLAYSYSVYDSFDCLSRWATRLILSPARRHQTTSWFYPLLTSPGVIVCALREAD
jgi:ubiquinone/menaquinone biosynthesis C-methylase UbiE